MKQLWKVFQAVLGLIFRHPLLGTSIIPVLPDGRVVLIQRRDNGSWGLPGGMVEWGENIHTTVKRELAEETGLNVVRVGRLVGVYSAPDRDRRFHSICITLEVEVQGELGVQDTLEIKTARAFYRAELPYPLNADNDRHLQDYFDGSTVIS